MNVEAQAKLNTIFLETALAYEIGGDWKNVLKHYKRSSKGIAYKFCKKGLQSNEISIHHAVGAFLKEI